MNAAVVRAVLFTPSRNSFVASTRLSGVFSAGLFPTGISFVSVSGWVVWWSTSNGVFFYCESFSDVVGSPLSPMDYLR